MKPSAKRHTPNKVPAWDQVLSLATSGFLLVYGAHGVWINDLAIRVQKRRYGGKTHHLHDDAAILMYAAFIFFIACFISEVIDHYDKRNNEKEYKLFFSLSMFAGLLFSFLAFMARR